MIPSAWASGADADRDAQLLSRVIDTISAGPGPGPRRCRAWPTLVTETTDTDVCFVHLLDERARTLQLRGATPPSTRWWAVSSWRSARGWPGWVADHGEPAVIIDNKSADPRYRYIPALRGEDFTSMVSVPMVTPLGHLVGVLNVHTRERREFTQADVELLSSVAGLVAGAIENARLHQRLAEREEALERFAEQIVHGRNTSGAGWPVRSTTASASASSACFSTCPRRPTRSRPTRPCAAEQVARAQELAAAALDETRSAIAGLRPPVLDDLGLAASLESLAHSFPSCDVAVEAPS